MVDYSEGFPWPLQVAGHAPAHKGGESLVTDRLADAWDSAVNYKELALPVSIYPATWNPNKP